MFNRWVTHKVHRRRAKMAAKLHESENVNCCTNGWSVTNHLLLFLYSSADLSKIYKLLVAQCLLNDIGVHLCDEKCIHNWEWNTKICNKTIYHINTWHHTMTWVKSNEPVFNWVEIIKKTSFRCWHTPQER